MPKGGREGEGLLNNPSQQDDWTEEQEKTLQLALADSELDR